jgi:drug/metabolite transporter superfamily protein YnfA
VKLWLRQANLFLTLLMNVLLSLSSELKGTDLFSGVTRLIIFGCLFTLPSSDSLQRFSCGYIYIMSQLKFDMKVKHAKCTRLSSQ